MTGNAGPHSVAGVTFDRLLGLRSTLFSLRFELSELPVPTLPPFTGIAVDQQQSDLLSPEPFADSGDARPDSDRDAAVGADATIGSGTADVVESLARRDAGIRPEAPTEHQRKQPRATVAQTNDRGAADYAGVVIVVALFGTAGVIVRSQHKRKGERRP
jgi:hypothetical protein